MNADYDVIIIGGGINGAAAAAALTRRGYRILLLEERDFASGTTAASTKLIHGGLRYLASGEAGLVHESLQSRERLLRERPHLVRPLPFLLPVYRGDPRPGAYVRAGLFLYDLLSPRKVSPRHRAFSRQQIRRLEPALRTQGLTATYLYYDAQVVLPERLCMEYLSEARDAGADIRNYSSVDFIVVGGGVARGVDFHDVLSGARHQASAQLIVNAAGPWVDAVLAATGESVRPRLGPTKGSHLVLDLEGRGPRHAILAPARSDGRPVFVIPWLDHHLVGTTDVRFAGDPRDAVAEEWEVEYLLEETARILPGVGIDRDHVRYAYSGVRPLPHHPRPVAEGSISRRHYVIDHSAEGVRGLLSIVGGKLTTAERTAEAVVRAARGAIGAPPRTARPRALPGQQPGRVSFLRAEVQEHLRDRYGPRAADVAAYAALEPTLSEPLSPHHPDIGAQVLYAVEHEGARTVADVLLRRTAIGLTHDLGRAAAPRAAAIIADQLGWSELQRRSALRDYEREVRRTFTMLPAEWRDATEDREPDASVAPA